MTISPLSSQPQAVPATYTLPAPVEVAKPATSQDLVQISGVAQGDYDYIGTMLSTMIGAGAGATVGGVGGGVAGAYVGARSGAVGGAVGALVGGIGGAVVGALVGGTIAYNKASH